MYLFSSSSLRKVHLFQIPEEKRDLTLLSDDEFMCINWCWYEEMFKIVPGVFIKDVYLCYKDTEIPEALQTH